MSRRTQPEYRSGSVGGGVIALVLVLAVILIVEDQPTPAPPEVPDINIAIDVPTIPTTTTGPTTSADLSGARASGAGNSPKQDTETGVAGSAPLIEQAKDWAHDFALDCFIDKLTGRGLCLPWPDHLP